MNPHVAIAVLVEDRYFSSRGKRGQVLTAWSIAGARLWPCPMGPDDEAEVQRICADCHAKGRDAQMVHVGQRENSGHNAPLRRRAKYYPKAGRVTK